MLKDFSYCLFLFSLDLPKENGDGSFFSSGETIYSFFRENETWRVFLREWNFKSFFSSFLLKVFMLI